VRSRQSRLCKVIVVKNNGLHTGLLLHGLSSEFCKLAVICTNSNSNAHHGTRAPCVRCFKSCDDVEPLGLLPTQRIARLFVSPFTLRATGPPPSCQAAAPRSEEHTS